MDNKLEHWLAADGNDDLRISFLRYLNLAHCGLSHLSERFAEISEHPIFSDMGVDIGKLKLRTEKKLASHDELYLMLGVSFNFEQCSETLAHIENVFNAIHTKDADPIELKKFFLLFYIRTIDNLEHSSYNMMQMIASIIYHKNVVDTVHKLALSERLV